MRFVYRVLTVYSALAMKDKPKKSQNERAQESIEAIDWNQLQCKVNLNASLSIIEACAFLGMPFRTINDKVNKGDIPVVKMGRRLSFLPSDLEEYRQSKRERRVA